MKKIFGVFIHIILSLVILLSIQTNAQKKMYYWYSGENDERLNITNRVFNSGAKSTTDFVQTEASGDPDGFSINANFTVETYGANKTLKVVRLGGANSYVGIQDASGFDGVDEAKIFVAGRVYNIRIKYTSNGANVRMIASGVTKTLDVVNDWSYYTTQITATADPSLLISFNGESDTSKYFEIDWIEVWEN